MNQLIFLAKNIQTKRIGCHDNFLRLGYTYIYGQSNRGVSKWSFILHEFQYNNQFLVIVV